MTDGQLSRITVTPKLLQKLPILQKHSQAVLVSNSSVSTPSICIQKHDLCDAQFGIDTKSFMDLVKNTDQFQIDGGYITYSYSSIFKDNIATITKKTQVLSLNYVFEFPNPIFTAKVIEFRCLSTDPTTVKFQNNLLVLTTSGYVKTRNVLAARKVDGPDEFSITISGRDLKIVEELEGEIVLCYYEDCLVFFEFEEEITTVVVARRCQ